MSKLHDAEEINYIRIIHNSSLFLYSEVATEEVSHLFVAADENHDDRLSHQEIIDNSATFVGSEATNYGENLYSMGHVGDEL